MKGRLENSLINEERARKLIAGKELYFQEYYYSLSASKEPTTIHRYVNNAIVFVDFMKKTNKDFDIKSLKKIDIDMFMDSIKYNMKKGEIKQTSDRRMATVWSYLHSFVKFLVSAGYLDKDIMEAVERPKIRNRVDRVYMTPEEIKMIINNVEKARISAKCEGNYKGWETRDLIIIRLLIETGMRVTALTEINIEDINFDNAYIQVIDKRGKIHKHPVSKETLSLIEEWIYYKEFIEEEFNVEDKSVLFISAKFKRRMESESINDIIQKYTDGIDKKITAHKFRSTYATNLYQATEDIYFVKECMGHTSVSTTQIYVEPNADSKEKALGIMSNILKT